MPVEQIVGGGVMITGESINHFRMLTLKTALRAELNGMKLCRGVNAFKVLKMDAEAYGWGKLPKGKQEQYDWYCNKLKELGLVK